MFQSRESDPHGSPERPVWLDMAAVTLLLVATLKIMANATISPALPALAASFSDDPAAAYLTRFLVSAPSLSVVLVAPFAGIAADRYGRAPLLVAGVLLFVVAGSAGSYLPDLFTMLLSRLLLGVAVALIMTAQVALVGDLFSGARRGAFMGWQTAAINFSGFLFIGAGGLLASVSPRLPFLIYALPVLMMPLLVSVMRRERVSRKNVSEQAIDGDPALEEDAKAWLLPALAVSGLTLLTVMMFFLMPSQLPFYLDANGFDSAPATAAGLGALTLTGGILAMVFKPVSTRIGLASTLGLGFSVMAAGFAVLAFRAEWLFVLSGAALIGAGYAFVQPGLLMLALQVAPAARRGSVAGMVTTSMFLGQVVSPLLLTPVIQSRGFPLVYYGSSLGLLVFALAALVPLMLRLNRHREGEGRL